MFGARIRTGCQSLAAGRVEASESFVKVSISGIEGLLRYQYRCYEVCTERGRTKKASIQIRINRHHSPSALVHDTLIVRSINRSLLFDSYGCDTKNLALAVRQTIQISLGERCARFAHHGCIHVLTTVKNLRPNNEKSPTQCNRNGSYGWFLTSVLCSVTCSTNRDALHVCDRMTDPL